MQRDAVDTSLMEVQRTLEAIQPRQAKDLILRMLEDEGLDSNDDVVADVVTIVKAMPRDKLKRIFGEFKTGEEREKLHRIMVEIGEFHDREGE